MPEHGPDQANVLTAPTQLAPTQLADPIEPEQQAAAAGTGPDEPQPEVLADAHIAQEAAAAAEELLKPDSALEPFKAEPAVPEAQEVKAEPAAPDADIKAEPGSRDAAEAVKPEPALPDVPASMASADQVEQMLDGNGGVPGLGASEDDALPPADLAEPVEAQPEEPAAAPDGEEQVRGLRTGNSWCTSQAV